MEGRQIAGAVVGTVIKVVVTAVFLMFVYRYAVEAYDYGYRIFGEEPMDAEPGRDVTVTIGEYDSTQDVAEMLMQWADQGCKAVCDPGEAFRSGGGYAARHL